MRRLSVLLCAAFLAAACSEPPQKEIDRAQGALDAARAAGAEHYATDTFAAAAATLQQSQDAVEQRDYRLALSLAIDAYERAQTAAKEAADGKARARGDGERAAAVTAATLQQLQTRLKAAEAAKVPARELRSARAAAADAEATLQEVRAMLNSGDYLAASEALKGATGAIHEQIRLLEEAMAARAARPSRRRR
jgi:predicted S18 family serine protease